MKKGKIFLVLIAILLCVMIGLALTKVFKKTETGEQSDITEITPGEELTEEQERQTMIALYYTNIETNTLIPEARVIDAKTLLQNPYKTLMEYLIEKPKNDKFKSSLPEGTKFNNATLKGDMLLLDLSKEFIENQNEENLNLGIYSIVNTLTELNEVNSVKIIIDGEEKQEIEGTNITLNESFIRKD